VGKLSVVALAVAMALAACGGGSDGGNKDSQEVADLRAQTADQQKTIEELRQQLSADGGSTYELANQIAGLATELGTQRALISQLQAATNGGSADLALLDQKITAQQETIADILSDLTRNGGSIEEIRLDVESLRAALADQQQAINSLQGISTDLAALRATIADQQEAIEQLEQSLAALEGLSAEINNLQATITSQGQAIAQLQSSLAIGPLLIVDSTGQVAARYAGILPVADNRDSIPMAAVSVNGNVTMVPLEAGPVTATLNWSNGRRALYYPTSNCSGPPYVTYPNFYAGGRTSVVEAVGNSRVLYVGSNAPFVAMPAGSIQVGGGMPCQQSTATVAVVPLETTVNLDQVYPGPLTLR